MIPSTIDIPERLNYGRTREPIVFEQLNELFDTPICKSLHDCSFFDFYNPSSYYLIELKSLRYSFDKYNTCIMNLTKTVNSRMLFVWEYLEDNGTRDLYYHFFDPTHKYISRDINQYNNLDVRDVIDVDKCDIEKFDFNTTYTIDDDSTENEKMEFYRLLKIDFYIHLKMKNIRIYTNVRYS